MDDEKDEVCCSSREGFSDEYMRGFEAGKAEALGQANSQLYMIITHIITAHADAIKNTKKAAGS